MLTIRVEKSGKMAIVRCEGRMTFGEPLEILKDIVLCRMESLVKLDLSGVEVMDAAGLGVLASLCRLCYAASIDFNLVNPNRHVQELLKLFGLDAILEIDTPLLQTAPDHQASQRDRVSYLYSAQNQW